MTFAVCVADVQAGPRKGQSCGRNASRVSADGRPVCGSHKNFIGTPSPKPLVEVLAEDYWLPNPAIPDW